MAEHPKTQYDHMNKDGIPLKLDMDELADLIVSRNFGLVRMLAALCRAARRDQVETQARYDARGDHDVKATSPLADELEHILRKDLYW